MSEHMMQKYDDQIEGGMNEREFLLKEIEQLKKENEKLKKRDELREEQRIRDFEYDLDISEGIDAIFEG